jgi:hypothetical protein
VFLAAGTPSFVRSEPLVSAGVSCEKFNYNLTDVLLLGEKISEVPFTLPEKDVFGVLQSSCRGFWSEMLFETCSVTFLGRLASGPLTIWSKFVSHGFATCAYGQKSERKGQ